MYSAAASFLLTLGNGLWSDCTSTLCPGENRWYNLILKSTSSGSLSLWRSPCSVFVKGLLANIEAASFTSLVILHCLPRHPTMALVSAGYWCFRTGVLFITFSFSNLYSWISGHFHTTSLCVLFRFLISTYRIWILDYFYSQVFGSFHIFSFGNSLNVSVSQGSVGVF